MRMYQTPTEPLLEILNTAFPHSLVGHDDEGTRLGALELLHAYATALPDYDREIVMAIWELSEASKAVVALHSRDVFVVYGPDGWRHKRLNDDEFHQLLESELRTPFDSWFETP